MLTVSATMVAVFLTLWVLGVAMSVMERIRGIDSEGSGYMARIACTVMAWYLIILWLGWVG